MFPRCCRYCARFCSTQPTDFSRCRAPAARTFPNAGRRLSNLSASFERVLSGLPLSSQWHVVDRSCAKPTMIEQILIYLLFATFFAGYASSAIRLLYLFVAQKIGRLRVLPGSTTGLVLHGIGVAISIAIPCLILLDTTDGNALSFGVLYAIIPIFFIYQIAECNLVIDRDLSKKSEAEN